MLPDIDIEYRGVVDTLTIDDLDRQLTQCLGVDGRASFAAIAEVLGVSDQTIARRYRRLRSAGTLRVVGLPSPKKGWASCRSRSSIVMVSITFSLANVEIRRHPSAG